MTASKSRWADLGPRLSTALVLVFVGGLAIWLGGWVYTLLLILLLGGVVWEMTGITASAPLWTRIAWGLMITFGVVVIAVLRLNFGLWPTVWLISVVIASDVGAYFVGRFVGGPKLAPRVSPGKTISGAIGGLVLACLIGVIVMPGADFGLSFGMVLLASAIVSVASMGGDLAQSAVKRAFGVKDSGTLLPGHGGLWDRFDGMIGAGWGAVLVFVLVS